MLDQYQMTLHTKGRGLINITDEIAKYIEPTEIAAGLCHIFLHHTSASLILCENYDPLVQNDLENFMQQLIPDDASLYQHNTEGPDDMPSHIRSVLTSNFLMVPITNSKLALGRWQGIFVWEHRHHDFERHLTVTLLK